MTDLIGKWQTADTSGKGLWGRWSQSGGCWGRSARSRRNANAQIVQDNHRGYKSAVV